VRADTADRVLAVAQELGYRVNPLAKGLKEQRSMTIGMLLPDLANPLFPPIVRGVEDGLRKMGYALILANTDRDVSRERDLLGVLLSRHVDGLILATAEREYPILDDFVDSVPTVLVNRTTEFPLVSTVASDDHLGMGQAIRHLVGLGHTQIAHVGGSLLTSTGAARAQHFSTWMQNQDLIADRDLMVVADRFNREHGRKACTELLDRGREFTAIVAANDLIALGCYAALRSRGLRVPEDVSVVGYNSIAFCEEFAPPLTSVHVPKYDIGLRAASLILEVIAHPETLATTVLLPTTLQVRASTAPPRTVSL
jgi:LacI family transcriptional regulator